MEGFCPLASGSKGNALYLGTPKAKLLIDAGLSVLQLKRRLEQIGVELGDIDAILLTHEHADHIRGLEVLTNKFQIPIFANLETAKAVVALGSQVPYQFKIFTTGEEFFFQDLRVVPFSIQHDAMDPVGFSIWIEEEIKLGICADLGQVTPLVLRELAKSDYLYLEANHQVEMVHACPRPPSYKLRVLGQTGHLSNRQCAAALKELLHQELKQVYLAHLSSECNHPELARKIVQEVLNETKVELCIAQQEIVSKSICF